MSDQLRNQINDIIEGEIQLGINDYLDCLLYTSPSPRDS